MKLHYFQDGRIFMKMNLRGIQIKKTFNSCEEYFLEHKLQEQLLLKKCMTREKIIITLI